MPSALDNAAVAPHGGTIDTPSTGSFIARGRGRRLKERLIELILLNIGLEAGIITPTLFTILVLVAIVTTLMASPIFEAVYGRHRTDERLVPAEEGYPHERA